MCSDYYIGWSEFWNCQFSTRLLKVDFRLNENDRFTDEYKFTTIHLESRETHTVHNGTRYGNNSMQAYYNIF